MKHLTRVERTARALHKGDIAEQSHFMPGTVKEVSWSDLSIGDKEWYRRRAKAALGVKP